MAKAPVRKPKKKVCVFCKDKAAQIDYKDTTLLRKYISDRGKIRARRVTGNCRTTFTPCGPSCCRRWTPR
jgi:small subunit ribosomal protein S18